MPVETHGASRVKASLRSYAARAVNGVDARLRRLARTATPADDESRALQQRFEALSRGKFLGVPTEDFAFAGREQLEFLLRAGLQRSSLMLDIGCGVLRAGYWLIR